MYRYRWRWVQNIHFGRLHNDNDHDDSMVNWLMCLHAHISNVPHRKRAFNTKRFPLGYALELSSTIYAKCKMHKAQFTVWISCLFSFSIQNPKWKLDRQTIDATDFLPICRSTENSQPTIQCTSVLYSIHPNMQQIVINNVMELSATSVCCHFRLFQFRIFDLVNFNGSHEITVVFTTKWHCIKLAKKKTYDLYGLREKS